MTSKITAEVWEKVFKEMDANLKKLNHGISLAINEYTKATRFCPATIIGCLDSHKHTMMEHFNGLRVAKGQRSNEEKPSYVG